MKLDGAERMILQAIHDIQGESTNYIDDSQIAAVTRISSRDVRDWLETLEGKDFIQRARTTEGDSAYITAKGRLALKQSAPAVEAIPEGSDSAIQNRSIGKKEVRKGVGKKKEVRKGVSTLELAYEAIHPVYKGHYSQVLKCLSRKTREVCLVKETPESYIDQAALHVIRTLRNVNIAGPNQIWVENGNVYEELPYVGGVRLSRTIVPGMGGLSGAVLESFCNDFHETLAALHRAGIIHRDIHPDNIYLLVSDKASDDASQNQAQRSWYSNSFGGRPGKEFRLSWVLVDCTSATLASNPMPILYRHGPYTPEEQMLGHVTPASDMYAFGATLYYGITGTDIPSFQRRKDDPRVLTEFPSGSHPRFGFANHLKDLLSLEPALRPMDNDRRTDTVANEYTGTLQISETLLLVCDTFPMMCQCVPVSEALPIFWELRETYQAREASEKSFNIHLRRICNDLDAWITRLTKGGIR
jgi:serine/threonine protein kinase